MENPYLTPNSASPQSALPPEAIARIEALLSSGRRTILGIAAGPGAGKSTLAQALHARFSAQSQYLPMDGFHLANRELARLQQGHCKGAPHTFDSAGYVHLLERVRRQPEGETIYAPDFDRQLEEPIAGAIPLHADKPLIITEGNYLLLEDGAWSRVRGLLDEAWYLDLDPALRHARLLARHMRFGRSESEARAWIDSTDEPNAVRIAATRHRADWVLQSW
jgi:pantothenate kinase